MISRTGPFIIEEYQLRGEMCIRDREKAPEAVKEVIDFSKVQIEPLFEEAVDFETFSKSDFRARCV